MPISVPNGDMRGGGGGGKTIFAKTTPCTVEFGCRMDDSGPFRCPVRVRENERDGWRRRVSGAGHRTPRESEKWGKIPQRGAMRRRLFTAAPDRPPARPRQPPLRRLLRAHFRVSSGPCERSITCGCRPSAAKSELFSPRKSWSSRRRWNRCGNAGRLFSRSIRPAPFRSWWKPTGPWCATAPPSPSTWTKCIPSGR